MAASISSKLLLTVVLLGLALALTASGRSLVRAQSPEITLTYDDNGSTQPVSVGTAIRVRLGRPDVDWTVTSSDSSVLQGVPTSQVGDQQGVWTALAPGQAKLSGTGKPRCDPGSVCPAFLLGWSATIIVGGDPTQIAVVQSGSQSQVQDCGSVNTLGGHPTSSDAMQAEDCFFQAYLSCTPATLTAQINGVDAGTTHMFSLSGTSGACTITDVAQTRVIPRPAGPQMTYTCAGLSENASGLVFSSCGSLGDVSVPSS